MESHVCDRSLPGRDRWRRLGYEIVRRSQGRHVSARRRSLPARRLRTRLRAVSLASRVETSRHQQAIQTRALRIRTGWRAPFHELPRVPLLPAVRRRRREVRQLPSGRASGRVRNRLCVLPRHGSFRRSARPGTRSRFDALCSHRRSSNRGVRSVSSGPTGGRPEIRWHLHGMRVMSHRTLPIDERP